MTQWNHRQWALEGVARYKSSHFLVHVPADFLCISNDISNGCKLHRGYIGVVYPGSDAKDVAPQFQLAYPNYTFALIAARAFVGSRSLDYILAEWPHVNKEQIALTGHSRNGKQSLIFAAFDERVTATVGSSPGVPIASPYLLRAI